MDQCNINLNFRFYIGFSKVHLSSHLAISDPTISEHTVFAVYCRQRTLLLIDLIDCNQNKARFIIGPRPTTIEHNTCLMANL